MIKEVLDVMKELAKEGLIMVVVTMKWVLPVRLPTGCCLWMRG